MSTIKKATGKFGNELEFAKYDHLGKDTIVVHDNSTQSERDYTIGELGELEMAEEKVIITSFEQVMKAWEDGEVWF